MKSEYYGKKYNRLTVIDEVSLDVGTKHNKTRFFVCMCECGKETIQRKYSVLSGKVKSCGCYSIERTIRASTKHGMCKGNTTARIYTIWASMKKRCNNPNMIQFKNYGGRGIKVCKEWNDSFECFMNWAYSNGYNDSLTIDRINNDGDYEPSNCRWITNKEQQFNKRTNRIIEIDGESHTITEWIHIKNLPKSIIQARIYSYGWNPVDAITKPIIKEKKVRSISPDGSINEYKSAKSAAEILSISAKTIRGACNGYPKTYKGLIWEYI